MAPRLSETSDDRLSKYLDGLASVIGRASRVGPLRDVARGGPLIEPRTHDFGDDRFQRRAVTQTERVGLAQRLTQAGIAR